MSLYIRAGLWLLRPILDAYHKQRVNERGTLQLVEHDIRRRVKSGELHL